MTPAVVAARKAVQTRNATEEAILDAARDALADTEYRRLTMDVIAKRAFTSRTALYFYFPNKRALVDRLILRAFLDMYAAAWGSSMFWPACCSAAYRVPLWQTRRRSARS